MIDKLKLTAKEVMSPESLHKQLASLSTDTKGNLDRLYLCSRSYTINGKSVVLKTMNKQSNISPICIEVNPGHYDCFSELFETIDNIIDVSLLRITRLDHKVDLDVSYAEIQSKIDVKFKVLRKDYYGSKQTGMMIGGGNESICIYDKAEQSKVISSLTRIEVREKFKSLKVTCLSELDSLLEYNPFSKIRIMDLKEPSDYGSPKSYQLLKTAIESKGLLIARKELSINNNFGKTFEKYLERSPLDEVMLSSYRENLTKFLRS